VNEPTRGLIYRALLVIAVVYLAITRPDSLEEWLPVIGMLASSGLATSYTNVKRPAQ
jgi:hypothetical protein